MEQEAAGLLIELGAGSRQFLVPVQQDCQGQKQGILHQLTHRGRVLDRSLQAGEFLPAFAIIRKGQRVPALQEDGYLLGLQALQHVVAETRVAQGFVLVANDSGGDNHASQGVVRGEVDDLVHHRLAQGGIEDLIEPVDAQPGPSLGEQFVQTVLIQVANGAGAVVQVIEEGTALALPKVLNVGLQLEEQRQRLRRAPHGRQERPLQGQVLEQHRLARAGVSQNDEQPLGRVPHHLQRGPGRLRKVLLTAAFQFISLQQVARFAALLEPPPVFDGQFVNARIEFLAPPRILLYKHLHQVNGHRTSRVEGLEPQGFVALLEPVGVGGEVEAGGDARQLLHGLSRSLKSLRIQNDPQVRGRAEDGPGLVLVATAEPEPIKLVRETLQAQVAPCFGERVRLHRLRWLDHRLPKRLAHDRELGELAQRVTVGLNALFGLSGGDELALEFLQELLQRLKGGLGPLVFARKQVLQRPAAEVLGEVFRHVLRHLFQDGFEHETPRGVEFDECQRVNHRIDGDYPPAACPRQLNSFLGTTSHLPAQAPAPKQTLLDSAGLARAATAFVANPAAEGAGIQVACRA